MQKRDPIACDEERVLNAAHTQRGLPRWALPVVLLTLLARLFASQGMSLLC